MSGKKEVKFMATDKSAKKIQDKMDQIHEDAMPNQNIVAGREKPIDPVKNPQAAPRQPGVMDEQFPTNDLTEEDPRDKIMAAKIALADKSGVTPFGQLIASDEDFQWLDEKRAKADEADMQAWFAYNYDHASPEQKAIAKKLWPNFYEQRDKALDKNVELQRRIAKQKLHGIQTPEDLKLAYAIEAGYVPADPLENIMHPERVREAQAYQARQATYVRGLLNPRARTTRGGGTQSRGYNASVLTGFNAESVPGKPYLSGTRTADGTPFGFSVNDWPLTDSAARGPETEGNLFGPDLLSVFTGNGEGRRSRGRAAVPAGGGPDLMDFGE